MPAAPTAPPTEAARDTTKADRLAQEATAALAEDAGEAETLMRSALAADLFHGPAHNNIGVMLLGQGELYDAAQEFEWARKLMPGHPDPRVNPALTLEAAGRDQEAFDSFETALEGQPRAHPAMTRPASEPGRQDTAVGERHPRPDIVHKPRPRRSSAAPSYCLKS